VWEQQGLFSRPRGRGLKGWAAKVEKVRFLGATRAVRHYGTTAGNDGCGGTLKTIDRFHRKKKKKRWASGGRKMNQGV